MSAFSQHWTSSVPPGETCTSFRNLPVSGDATMLVVPKPRPACTEPLAYSDLASSFVTRKTSSNEVMYLWTKFLQEYQGLIGSSSNERTV